MAATAHPPKKRTVKSQDGVTARAPKRLDRCPEAKGEQGTERAARSDRPARLRREGRRAQIGQPAASAVRRAPHGPHPSPAAGAAQPQRIAAGGR